MASAFVSNLFDLGLEKGGGENTRFLQLVLEQIADRLDRPTPYRSPWGTLFSLGGAAGRRGVFSLGRQEPALRPRRDAQV
jgi:hypothetical protein